LNLGSIFGMLCVQEMTPDANIIAARFTKSVIKSCAAMSYVEAQARMDDRCFLAFDLLSLTILICENAILSGLVGQIIIIRLIVFPSEISSRLVDPLTVDLRNLNTLAKVCSCAILSHF
jgi:hypothetical protein